jgi:hypothetical protein
MTVEFLAQLKGVKDMLGLKFGKKDRAPLVGTYPKKALKFHFNIEEYRSDQIVSQAFLDLISTYIEYKIAIERAEEALQNATLNFQEKVAQSTQLKKDENAAEKMRKEIMLQVENLRNGLSGLSEELQKEIAVELKLEKAEQLPTEKSITEQLLNGTTK